MDQQKIKLLIDTCFMAKRIIETMKELPSGIKPRHIHVVECIFRLSQTQAEVRVSDVSNELHITTPSVTKLINELEGKKVIEKYSLKGDKRVTLLQLTKLGTEYEHTYVTKYHTQWADNLLDVTDEEVATVVQVVSKLLKSMPTGNSYEK